MIRYLQVAGDRAAEIPTTFRTAPTYDLRIVKTRGTAWYYATIPFMNILTGSARKYAVGVTLILLLLAVAGFAANLSPAKTYRNNVYHFTVRIPKAYTVSEFPENSGIYYDVVFSH